MNNLLNGESTKTAKKKRTSKQGVLSNFIIPSVASVLFGLGVFVWMTAILMILIVEFFSLFTFNFIVAMFWAFLIAVVISAFVSFPVSKNLINMLRRASVKTHNIKRKNDNRI